VSFVLHVHLGVELKSDCPVVAEGFLSITEVFLGGDNIWVELRSKVIINILSWVLPLSLGSSGSNLEFVSNDFLSFFEVLEVVVDVSVSTEIWNKVVDLVSSILLLVLELGAA